MAGQTVFPSFLKPYFSVSGNCISQLLKEYFHFNTGNTTIASNPSRNQLADCSMVGQTNKKVAQTSPKMNPAPETDETRSANNEGTIHPIFFSSAKNLRKVFLQILVAGNYLEPVFCPSWLFSTHPLQRKPAPTTAFLPTTVFCHFSCLEKAHDLTLKESRVAFFINLAGN